MEITTEIENNGEVLRLDIIGRLEATTAPQLHQITLSIDAAAYKKILVDCCHMVYISSAGLREILFLAKRCSNVCKFKVVNLSEECMEMFHTTGFDSIMSVSKAKKHISSYSNLSLKEFLNAKADDTPDWVQVEWNDEHYTWSMIEKCAQIIASDLSELGVGKGSHVAIYGINSINWIFTFFAIQKLGGIAILLNPFLKPDELVLYSKLADIDYFCYGEGQASEEGSLFRLQELSEKIGILYDIRSSRRFMDRLPEYDYLKGRFNQTVMADDPAVMIFSSGSTGRPKGVLLSAMNILKSAYMFIEESYKTTSLDSICLTLPLFHIFGLNVGFLTNAIANARVIMPRDMHSETIIEYFERKQCTIMHAVPTMLLAICHNKSFSPEKMKSLRFTVIAGAAATETQLRMFKELMPENNFISAYGLSELAPATITRIHDSFYHLSQTVGKPMKNIEIRIQSPDGRKECAVGESGEVLLRGINLMLCYYKINLQDQSFDLEGWLKTGDMGYMDEDGYLHLTGRYKDVIIRGGENIIPLEIETAITSHPAVENSVVLGIPSYFYGEEVVACLKLKENMTCDEDELRRFLDRKLAKFKIPSYIFPYKDFPLLSNGKIDKVTLRKEAIQKVLMFHAEKEE